MGAHASTVFGSLGSAVSDDAAKLVGLEVNDIKNLHSRFTELHVCPGVDLPLFKQIFESVLADKCQSIFGVFDKLPTNGKVDVHEIFACCIICCSAFTGARIRILFEL